MCFAHGAGDTRIKEDALYQSGRDKRRVLEAALSCSYCVTGVWDKSLGGIVECRPSAEERLHASRAEEFRLILERTLEEIDRIPERLRF